MIWGASCRCCGEHAKITGYFTSPGERRAKAQFLAVVRDVHLLAEILEDEEEDEEEDHRIGEEK